MGYLLRDKLLLAYTVIVLVLSSVSYFAFQSHDPNRCKVLLQDGFWLNPSELLNWQPAGCMMHTYRADEAGSCLKDRRVLFVGGADTLDLFDGFVKKFDPTYTSPALGSETKISSNVSEVRFEYIWDPNHESNELKEMARGFADNYAKPALTVVGLGYEHLRHNQDFESWASHFRSLISDLKDDLKGRALRNDRIVIAPMLQPNMSQLNDKDRPLLTLVGVEKMNNLLTDFETENGIDVSYAFNKVVQGPGALKDGTVPVPRAKTVLADILLNLRCNAQLPKHYPYASTCCNSYPYPSWVQVSGFLFVGILVPLALVLSQRGYNIGSSTFLRLMPAARYHGPIIIMGLSVALCYYCDRTNIFGKEQKQTSPSQFFILMSIVIIASLYTLKTSEKELAFLNRDQTDEWKGWMQVFILVYHYVGVSKTPYIYQYIRVAPTSYLFMTGFGHTVYFLKKDDYSLKRFVATMLRLNLLNVLLAYAMGNDWLLYYFAPLVTWNFFVIYAIYCAGHRHNKNRKFVYAKMVVGAALNTAFYHVPGAVEFVWSILVALFRMQGDMREWRFRVTLDQYSAFPGMVAGILFLDWSSYSLPKSASWPRIQKVSIVVSVLIMLGYAVFEANQPSKIVYNQKHPYVSWLPCCAFVILRNSSPWLRSTHNRFFAWVGRGSLETFLLQFHMWLAADTAGLLTVGPPYLRGVNAVLTTVFFVWLASLVTESTAPLIEWIMGAEPKHTRPSLPTSFKSHPIQEVPKINDVAGSSTDEKVPSSAIRETDAMVSSAVPINGAPAEVSDNNNIESQESTRTFGEKLATATKDLRIRVVIILGAMAFMNWTYYI